MARAEIWQKLVAGSAIAGLLALAMVALSPALPANAALTSEQFEQCLFTEINSARAGAGVPAVEIALDLNPEVREWSKWMRFNEFEHMPSSLRNSILPPNWNTWGENIAAWYNSNLTSCSAVHDMLMGSSGHRANILGSGFRFLAVGAYVDSSGWWVTELFFNAPGYSPTCVGSFCDDDNSIFEGDIEKIAGAGITQGCNPPENTRFCPDERVTRGAMAAFLTRALDLPSAVGIDFIDDNGSVFEDSIERIAGAGITMGCNPPANTRFCTNEYVTRAQMAAFLQRALDLSTANGFDFEDDDTSIFERSIESIAAAGITQGCSPTRFCPDDYVTRGQMAAFLARALGL